MSEFKLPDVGEGLTEAEIVAWKVKVGDVVAINDIIVEIETAKSLVELPSPFAGTVLDLMVPEGETVPVGTPIISIGDASAAPAEAAPAAPATPAPTQAEMEIDLSNPRASGGGEGESLVGRNKAERGAVRRARRGAPTAGVAAGATAANAQAQGAFEPGPSPVVEGSDEPAVPATSAVPAGGRAQATALVPDAVTSPSEARALAKPPVRKLAKDLGIAAATPRGLVVPNVKGADSLTLPELGKAINALTRTAREGKTQPAEMSGGSFTITNVGVFGVDAGTPIINPGESAILCFGAVRPQPWVHKGKIKVRDITTLALSFDHRLVDGEKGSRFLADVAAVLEDPSAALLF